MEKQIPDALHDTGSNAETGKVGHATGASELPQAVQEGLPEKVERVLPEAIHPTGGGR
ncbi:hypothetical protein MMC11_007949 [Xylographa trunciseda]|nr:hypothetical protein [Xylographa trunciseda]